MSAIRSLWDGQRTLRKPYAISSIYEYAPLAHPSLNFRRLTLNFPNFQHPARMLRLQLLPERAALAAVGALHPLIPGVTASNGGITLIRRV
jgi:hypothetical protein